MEEVAIYGTKHFPNQHWFIYKRIESIFRQKKDIINSNDFDDVLVVSSNSLPEK